MKHADKKKSGIIKEITAQGKVKTTMGEMLATTILKEYHVVEVRDAALDLLPFTAICIAIYLLVRLMLKSLVCMHTYEKVYVFDIVIYRDR